MGVQPPETAAAEPRLDKREEKRVRQREERTFTYRKMDSPPRLPSSGAGCASRGGREGRVGRRSFSLGSGGGILGEMGG
jgi:hypothetical protein